MLLIHTILNKTEPAPQTNYTIHYDDNTAPTPQFSLHQIYMTNSDTPSHTSPLYNVQPTSHTSKNAFFLLYHILLIILNSITNLSSNFLTLQTLNTLHVAICYLNLKRVMQLIETMLVKSQLFSY